MRKSPVTVGFAKELVEDVREDSEDEKGKEGAE
jgi:hypothetical protein